ncbi:polysaccharide pyruvyl transferase family protein [Paracoccus beibuensis]|uniref:polysaccharide pyruvyl transferase family protein n=1 Tax=Paracoccus beibuensis TaxID=547602 RepID=UPI0022408BBD|nr:polysaccharide pyruvyl transferase family protein [Paracoccus beibuensis]
MNLWFWDHFLSGWRDHYPDRTLFGIGSILGTRVLQAYDRVLVCGSGSGYSSLGPVDPDRVRISWVRGPLTARLLGLDDSIAISDPASLLTVMPEFAQLPRGGNGTIFIPHRSTAQLQINWGRIGQMCNLQVVLPNQDAKEVIRKIIGADLVVTESMHGAIMADAFRIPWVPIKISNQFNDHKWNDWAMGLGLTIDAPESLALPKKFWRLTGTLRSQLRAARARKPAPQPAVGGPAGAKAARMPETGSFDLGEDGRQRVKKLLVLAAPVIERILAADIRRAMRHHVHLSAEGRTEDLIAQMSDRLQATNDDLHQSRWP